MKLKTLLTKAKKEITEEKDQAALIVVKGSLRAIEDCKTTLKRLETKHKELLNKDVTDLELDDFEY